MEIGFPEVSRICSENEISIEKLSSITGSFGKQIFIINQEYLLRVSERSMASEQQKFKRVAALRYAPKILQTGVLEQETGLTYYTLLTLLPGDDFVTVYQDITATQQKQLGEDVARFLDGLHEISGATYDIGLYVPALPRYPGTWREGHQVYWERLILEAEKASLKPENVEVIKKAHRFLQGSSEVLDDQAGPKLLHNDFHPRNILLDHGKFSGVIDWECSQFGEADFELCHLIHWCLYPPEPTIDFRPFLRAFFAASPRCTRIPNLPQRLAIYQVEHELQQLIWSRGAAADLRIPRLAGWLDGAVEKLFLEIEPQR